MSGINEEVVQLRNLFATIPALVVSAPRDVEEAGKLINEVSSLLGAGPGSRPAVHPRPANAGVKWDCIDTDVRIKFDAVLDLLTSDAPHVQLRLEDVQEAENKVRRGLLRLAQLPPQSLSGTVFRTGE